MSTQDQVVVFASEGVVRSVAVRSTPAEEAPCIVVDYDERAERPEDVSPEDFEREKLGVDRSAFDQTATYIW
jgi:hypothetical protein